MRRRTPLYLDCDTGIDDAIALAYLAASRRVEMVGIGTVSGNTSAGRAALNTRDFLALLIPRNEVPIAVGAHDWLRREFDGGAPEVHGANGIGGVTLPVSAERGLDLDAARLLVELAAEYSGALEVLAIGPLTNLALALEIEPRIQHQVARVTVMGGAVWVPGNVSPVAEANIANDPEAASIVLAAGWPVTLVPLDVTMQHLITVRHLAHLAADPRPSHTALAAMVDHYMDFYEPKLGTRAAVLHDPLAAAVATRAVHRLRHHSTGIQTVISGAERGRTKPVTAGPRVDVISRAPRSTAGSIVRQILSVRNRAHEQP